MEIPTALAAELATLTQATGDPDTDIETAMRLLDSDLYAAIDSYLGLRIISSAGGAPVVLTAAHDPDQHAPVRSSVRIPLATLSTGEPTDALIFYAANPGAFVDLAADLSWALTVDYATLTLDTDLDIDLSLLTNSGIAEMSMINQAIGALAAQGLTPEDAAVELQYRADSHSTTLYDAAHDLIAELTTRLGTPTA